MRLPYRPNADYLRDFEIPEYHDEACVWSAFDEGFFTEEEYDIAWKAMLKKRMHKKETNDPDDLKTLIVTTASICEDVIRAMIDPKNEDMTHQYCVFDAGNYEWMVSDPFKARGIKVNFRPLKPRDLKLVWKTSDPTLATDAVAQFRPRYPDVVAVQVHRAMGAFAHRSMGFIYDMQKRFQEVMMREWLSQTIPSGDDAQPVRGYSITCSQCGAVEHFKGTKFGADKAAEIVPKHFKQKGWVVHHRRDDQDQCPACVNAKTLARRAERGLPVPPAPGEATVEITSSATPLKTMGDLKKVVSIRPIPKTAEAPAMTASLVPTRAQNRLMQDAIAKVYPVAEQGYAKGASDHTVAATLDLPVDWIRQHREQFFGPAERIDLTTTEQRLAALKNRMTDLEEKGLKALADLKAQVEAREKAAIAEIETMKRIVKETEDKTLADIDACRDEITDLGKEMDDVRRRLGDVA